MSRFWEIVSCVPLLFSPPCCLSNLKHAPARELPLTARETVFSHLKLISEHVIWYHPNKVTQGIVCICKQKTLFTRQNQTENALPVNWLPNRISSPSSCISVTACLTIWEISLFVTAADPEDNLLVTFARLASPRLLGRARDVDQWIALDIRSLSSQSAEGAKNTNHCFSLY